LLVKRSPNLTRTPKLWFNNGKEGSFYWKNALPLLAWTHAGAVVLSSPPQKKLT